MAAVKSNTLKDPLLFGLIRDFFKVYLPTQKSSSQYTIKAYKFALDDFLDFVKEQKNISFSSITFEMIDRKILSDYLDKTEMVSSVSTRNHRLACVRAFYAYAAKIEPAAVIHCDEIRKVPIKKPSTPKVVEYMSEAAVTTILEQPNTSTKKGLRDQFMLLIFYDTGARISEVLNIKLRDVKLGSTPTVTLFGKNKKVRVVPLAEKIVEHYRNYISVFHPGESQYSEQYLFYTVRHGCKNPMGETAVRDMMKLYCDMARKICSDVPEKIFPHLWRHTRAMLL